MEFSEHYTGTSRIFFRTRSTFCSSSKSIYIETFTDHTYDYLGYAPRTFGSFRAIGVDAGNSRVYAGIHYQPSVDIGLVQGKKVTDNILRILDLH